MTTPSTDLLPTLDPDATVELPVIDPEALQRLQPPWLVGILTAPDPESHLSGPLDAEALTPEIPAPAPMSLADFIAWRRTELSVIDPARLLDAVHLVFDDLVEQYGDVPPNGSDSGWFRAGEDDS